MKIRKTLIAGIVLLALPVCSQNTKPQESPFDFVQSFYSWYVPLALKPHKDPACDIALKKKGHLFSIELRQALQEDSAAQAKASGEIVGIDSDPFLNTQDPEDQYEVGKVTQKGDHYFVNIHGIRSGHKDSKPHVIAELAKKDSHWVFIDFHSPRGQSLLSILKTLRNAREKDSKP